MSTPEGRHYYQNKAFDRLFGDIGDCPPETVYVDRAIGREVFDTILGGGSWQGEVKMFKTDRTILDIFQRAYAIQDQYGRIIGLVGLHTDITGRKRAEEELRSSERKFAAAFDASPDPIAITDLKTGNILDINRAFEGWSGYLREEMSGKTTKDLNFWVYPEERDAFITILNEQGTANNKEVTFRTKSGDLRNIMFSAKVFGIRDQTFMLSVAEDITESKQVEEALKASEDKYRRLFETMMDAFVSVDMAGVIQETNTSFNILLGYSVEELRQLTYKDLTPDKWHAFESNIVNDQIMVRGYSDVYEKEYARKDGTVFPAELRTFLMRDAEGSAVGMWAIVRDITERKQSEEALAESEEKFRATIGQSMDGILITDSDFRIIEWNATQTTIYGYTREEMLGRHLWEFQFATLPEEKKSPLFLEKMKMSMIGLHTSQSVAWIHSLHDFVVQSKDGQRKTVQISTFPIDFRDRKFFGSISRDITGRKKAEDALREANKKLNLLTGITRHDINNQLLVLKGYLSLLEEDQPDLSHNEFIQQISTTLQRISAMIQFTREYEDIGVTAPAWQNTRTLVDTAANQAQLGQVKVLNDLPAGIEVYSDPLIVNVFYNLMDNAVRYGEKITTIRFSEERSGDEIIVVCEDDGYGIPAWEKEKVFERGFGKNTGLKLALSREIFNITGITICEAGKPGRGARFEIMVPKGAWRMKPDSERRK
jgi:PAS domain S-box-containing protein